MTGNNCGDNSSNLLSPCKIQELCLNIKNLLLCLIRPLLCERCVRYLEKYISTSHTANKSIVQMRIFCFKCKKRLNESNVLKNILEPFQPTPPSPPLSCIESNSPLPFSKTHNSPTNQNRPNRKEPIVSQHREKREKQPFYHSHDNHDNHDDGNHDNSLHYNNENWCRYCNTLNNNEKWFNSSFGYDIPCQKHDKSYIDNGPLQLEDIATRNALLNDKIFNSNDSFAFISMNIPSFPFDDYSCESENENKSRNDNGNGNKRNESRNGIDKNVHDIIHDTTMTTNEMGKINQLSNATLSHHNNSILLYNHQNCCYDECKERKGEINLLLHCTDCPKVWHPKCYMFKHSLSDYRFLNSDKPWKCCHFPTLVPLNAAISIKSQQSQSKSQQPQLQSRQSQSRNKRLGMEKSLQSNLEKSQKVVLSPFKNSFFNQKNENVKNSIEGNSKITINPSQNTHNHQTNQTNQNIHNESNKNTNKNIKKKRKPSFGNHNFLICDEPLLMPKVVEIPRSAPVITPNYRIIDKRIVAKEKDNKSDQNEIEREKEKEKENSFNFNNSNQNEIEREKEIERENNISVMRLCTFSNNNPPLNSFDSPSSFNESSLSESKNKNRNRNKKIKNDTNETDKNNNNQKITNTIENLMENEDLSKECFHQRHYKYEQAELKDRLLRPGIWDRLRKEENSPSPFPSLLPSSPSPSFTLNDDKNQNCN